MDKELRTTKMAPYILKGGRWVDANTDLDIRDNDSLSSPTNSKVPKVHAYKAGKWEQIYPPTEQPGGGTTISPSNLKCWQGSKADKSVWGWAYSDGNSNMSTAGQGFFGTGSYSWENDIHKEYAGWTSITLATLKNAGYKGLGSPGVPGKVKKVTKVTFSTLHYSGTGYPGHVRQIGLVASNVADPFGYPKPGKQDQYNPTIASNRSSIMWSDNASALNNAGWNDWTFTGAAAMDIFKDFLNGGWSSIITFNGHRPGNYEMWDTNYDADGDGDIDSDDAGIIGHRLLYMSADYFKAKEVKIKIDYVYEP